MPFWSRRLTAPTGPTGPTGAKEVEDEVERAKRRNATTDSRLRQYLGYGALVAMPVQLAAADYAFYRYGHAYGWKIPVVAINGWLAAAVVQLFIILRGLGRYLFPPINPKNEPQDRP
jgi:hypothetical protein